MLVELPDSGRSYRIERGDLVHINSWSIHTHQRWQGRDYHEERCTEIHLEYWLDPQTRRFVNNPRLLAFGKGKRDCIGRRVANKALESIFGLFMARYRVEAVNTIGDIKQSWGTVQVLDPAIPLLLHER